jgi:flagellin-like protein
MKILKSRKALSPVVASIILIAVTVAVSIAVAAWMGALTFTFMGTEELTVDTVTWTPNSQFAIVIDNSGTKDVTITQIQVNYDTTDVTQPGELRFAHRTL